jgi:CheY-like chemotaxis protein
MRLEFRLLVIDDNPDQLDAPLTALSDFLASKGFVLKPKIPKDLSEKAIRDLARLEGKDFDLALVDYSLGDGDRNGSDAIRTLRPRMMYTDIVFFSSAPKKDLRDQLAVKEIDGVYVSDRAGLVDSLVGVAKTVIGKAVDLSHMRGIAMAEVAELDVMMEETLLKVFATGTEPFAAKAKRTMRAYLEDANARLETIKPIIAEEKIVELVSDIRLFGSSERHQAIVRVVNCLDPTPNEHLEVLKAYPEEIIQNRNLLAHARQVANGDGTHSLKATKPGNPPITIDDAWMDDFRRKLHRHRAALEALCGAIHDLHRKMVGQDGS